MSESNGNGQVTYAEVRRMAYWLNAFTARELAEALHVHEAVGQRFVRALLWSGHVGGPIIQDSGAWEHGPEGQEEPIYEMRPMPEVTVKRNRYAPVWLTAVLEMGGFLLYDQRGVTVRIRTEREHRGPMSTPGSRQFHKNREREYQRQQQAREQRRRLDERRRIAQSQGKQFVPEREDDD